MMSAELSPQTWRALASRLRQTPWQVPSVAGLLGSESQTVRDVVAPLLTSLVAAQAGPEAIALCFEQLAIAQERLQQERDAWQLVWSGPDPRHAQTEDTLAVVEQLLQQAQESILISTYNLGRNQSLRHCYAQLAQRLSRGELQKVQIFFHPVELGDRLGLNPVATIRDWFFAEIWPWPCKPQAYVDRRCCQGTQAMGVHHAKCVIADQRVALVTSANFSEAAHRYNLEAGWLTQAAGRAQILQKQFEALIAEGAYQRIC